ncbi:trypsin-like peptidase domain-containing protein [Nannocystaceae bacterium ST9]
MDPIRNCGNLLVCILDPKGLGSGLSCGPDGWIVTNKHVAPTAGPYRVVLADGRNVAGVGVHQSPHHDLAIVKIALDTPEFFELATSVSGDYGVGSEVWALGHPRGCRFSVSRGIVSNPYRLIEDEYFVQSDVAINPGNSGGPLLDAQGRLVGIVSMMAANAQGLGFAVPGEIVADYVRLVRRLVASQVVRIPDALLAQAQEQQHGTVGAARDGIEQLLATGRAELVDLEEDEQVGGTMKLRRGNTQVEVRWDDGVLLARSRIAALGPHEAADARLLYELLELNARPDLGGGWFGIHESAVEVSMRRGTDRLTAAEAFAVVDRVLELGASWSERVGHMVLTRTQQSMLAEPNAYPPAPAQQGYPPQQPYAPPQQPYAPPQQPYAPPQQPYPQQPYAPAPQQGYAPSPYAQPPQQPYAPPQQGYPPPAYAPPQHPPSPYDQFRQQPYAPPPGPPPGPPGYAPAPPPAGQPAPPPPPDQGLSVGKPVFPGERKPVFGG